MSDEREPSFEKNNFTKYLACGVEVVEPVGIQGAETHIKDSCADCYHATIPLQGETGKSCAHVADYVKVLKLELRGVKEAICFDMSKMASESVVQFTIQMQEIRRRDQSRLLSALEQENIELKQEVELLKKPPSDPRSRFC